MPTTHAGGVVKYGPVKAATPRIPIGAGTELKKLLALIGITSRPGCSCNAMAAKMNANGAAWCLKFLPKIVETMQKEAKKRKLRFVPFGAYCIAIMAIISSKIKELLRRSNEAKVN